MKYPVGTKCWVVHTVSDFSVFRGLATTIISHEDDRHTCDFCKSPSHMVEVDLRDPWGRRRVFGCCQCSLVPIEDDPDAGKSVEEDLALPFDPRKVGETV